jgi:hypothetical protein
VTASFTVSGNFIWVRASCNFLCSQPSKRKYLGLAIIFFIRIQGGTRSNIGQVACYLSIRFLDLFCLFKRTLLLCILKSFLPLNSYVLTIHQIPISRDVLRISTYVGIAFPNSFRLSPSSLLLILQLCINFVRWLQLRLFVLNGTTMWAMSPAS